MNQSELEVNTYRRRQARENACRQVTIGFGFKSDWSKKVARDFLANRKRNAIAKLLSTNRSNVPEFFIK